MSTTYTWSIQALDRTTIDGIVYGVRYAVDAIHEVSVDEVISTTEIGYVSLEAPAEGTAVVPYSALTPEIVIGWAKSVLGAEHIEALEARLQVQLDEQAAPTKASGLPW